MIKRSYDRKDATLIPFIMAGDPSIEVSEKIAIALIEEGAGALELGVPFSDALADGPVIQRAAERALENHVSLDDVFALASRIAKRFPDIPLVLFSYLNPLLQYGLDAYVHRAREAGVTATLTVDLPPEEADEYCRLHAAAGLKTVFLTSPTTSLQRLPTIAHASTGFIYAVSRTGVTGVHQALSGTLVEEVQRIRTVTDRPVAVGFGISTGEQARAVAEIADGVVVGSAFVKLVEEKADPSSLVDAVRKLARELTSGMRAQ